MRKVSKLRRGGGTRTVGPARRAPRARARSGSVRPPARAAPSGPEAGGEARGPVESVVPDMRVDGRSRHMAHAARRAVRASSSERTALCGGTHRHTDSGRSSQDGRVLTVSARETTPIEFCFACNVYSNANGAKPWRSQPLGNPAAALDLAPVSWKLAGWLRRYGVRCPTLAHAAAYCVLCTMCSTLNSTKDKTENTYSHTDHGLWTLITVEDLDSFVIFD